MRDPFANYDAWLEAPYQQMVAENDAFVDWAEENGYDLDDPDDAQRAEEDYDEYIATLMEVEYDDYDDYDDDYGDYGYDDYSYPEDDYV